MKRLLFYGWGSPDTPYVQSHWRQMDVPPFDGVGIRIPADYRAWQQGNRSTTNQLGWLLMGTTAFRPGQFQTVMAELRSAEWRRLTDNFTPIHLSASQSALGLNWFDDARWAVIAKNFELMGRIAIAGRLKGFLFDPEHYSARLFHYPTQRAMADRPFVAYQQKARERGRQVMAFIGAEMEAPVILSLLSYSYTQSQMATGKPLAEVDSGLLPAFYDGILEVLPSDGMLVDGYEQNYTMETVEEFTVAYSQIMNGVQLSAVPDLYRAKVKAGFGLWLDYQQNRTAFTPQQFQTMLTHALLVSDGYVWLYHQTVGFLRRCDALGFVPPALVGADYLAAITAARQTV